MVLLEAVNHLVGIQKMKRHIFVFQLWALFIVFAVIPFYQAHDWVTYWVVIRAVRKFFRHLHRLYLDLGFRNEVWIIEAFCINGLCFTLPLEYMVSVIIVLVTFPIARHASMLQLKLCSACSIDLSLIYFVALFVSLPHFLSSLVYVCRKRERQIAVSVAAQRKRRA